MGLSLTLARRFFSASGENGKRASQPAIAIATAGIAVGLAVMLISVCVVRGFQAEVAGKLMGFGSHMEVLDYNTFASPESFPVTADTALINALENLPEAVKTAPSLVITDSQVFREVNSAIPSTLPLTSFSVLLAGAKGDLKTYVEGASAIDRLQDGDRVLIAEACTHVPDTEDIGRVKIPALLRKRAKVEVDVAAGNDFAENLSIYSLIIHCGACVASRQLVRSRIKKALREGVPITNYGIAIAALQGILQRIEIP